MENLSWDAPCGPKFEPRTSISSPPAVDKIMGGAEVVRDPREVEKESVVEAEGAVEAEEVVEALEKESVTVFVELG